MLLTVEHYHIALLYALLSQSTSKSFNGIKKLLVCILFLGLGHRTIIVDGNRIAITSLNMPIHAVVARRDLTTRKPLPVWMLGAVLERLGRCLERSVRLLVPVQLLGLLGPKRLRIGQALGQHLILEVNRGRFRHG